jgi:hypothetical protein
MKTKRPSRFTFVLVAFATLLPADITAQSVPVPASEQEWAQLWERVNENPYYLAGLGRENGAALITAAVQSRSNGNIWAAMAGTICAVDGPTRLALSGNERLAEFAEARTCFERIRSALPDTLSGTEADYVRSRLTQSLAEVLYETGAFGPADSLAAFELERSVSREGADIGNVVYRMNQVRGRVALRGGRRAEAIVFLQRASETRGSPQLASFGPQFVLARELLELGETVAVRQFLASVRSFWLGPAADAYLADAIATIDDGRIPDGPRWR